MSDPADLFTSDELQRIWGILVDRGLVAVEGASGMFGRTWHFRRDLGDGWYLRTWLWERQTELLLRLGRADDPGEVGPERRFATVFALEAHLDEALADLERWTGRAAELRCPLCGDWLYGREGLAGPVFRCRRSDGPPRGATEPGEPCPGARADDEAVREYG